MTPDQAHQIAVHIAHTWPDERHVDAWYALLLPLDHATTTATLTRCKTRYTGRLLPAQTFRTEYGPTWPDPDPAPTACDRCSSTGVIDVDDNGVEQHCDCGHGIRRATTVSPPTIASTGRYLTDDERRRGLEHVARLRHQLAGNRTA